MVRSTGLPDFWSRAACADGKNSTGHPSYHDRSDHQPDIGRRTRPASTPECARRIGMIPEPTVDNRVTVGPRNATISGNPNSGISEANHR